MGLTPAELLLSVNSTPVLAVILSSITVANLGRYLIGPDPAFHVPGAPLEADVGNPLTLALYFSFGALMGLVALVPGRTSTRHHATVSITDSGVGTP